MQGFLIIPALLIVLLCIYSLIFKKEVIRAFPPVIRYFFWGYFILSIFVVIWGLVGFLGSGGN
jgi:hypothetical protein